MYRTRSEEKKELTVRLLVLLALVSTLLLVGTVFYHFAEGWTLQDSLYFSAMNLTTRGISPLYPTSAMSILFSVAYLFVGVSLIIYAFSTLIAHYVHYYQEGVERTAHKVINKISEKKKDRWYVMNNRKR